MSSSKLQQKATPFIDENKSGSCSIIMRSANAQYNYYFPLKALFGLEKLKNKNRFQ